MIIGERVRLRAIEPEDLPLMARWRNDPEVYQHFYEHEPISLEMQRKWVESVQQRSDEKLWIIELIETKQAIGTISLVKIDWRNRKAEYARLVIEPGEHRDKGLGFEAESLILAYAFNHMNLHRVYCEVFVDNENVIGLHKKSGFQIEGIFKGHIFKEGRYRDIVYMGLLREDYLR